MKGISLKHKGNVALDEPQLGQATETVLRLPPMNESRGIIMFAMMSDMATYSLEIVAVIFFWRMAIGLIPINLPLVTSLWTIAIIVDIVFQSIALCCYGFCSSISGDDTNFIGSSSICCSIFRIPAPIGILCLIHKYTPQLQSIVDTINTPTALFDLYYTADHSLPMSAGPLGWDLFSLIPGVLILASLLAAVLGMLCLCGPCYLCCNWLSRYTEGSKARSHSNHGPLETLLGMASYGQRRSLHRVRHLSDSVSTSLEEGSNHTSYPAAQFCGEGVIVVKSIWLKHMFNFECIVFSIYVVAVRFTYKLDNVVFFHQLFWTLPAFFYIMAIISFVTHVSTRIFLYCFPKTELNRAWLPPTDFLASIKHVVLLFGAIWFISIRVSNPTKAVQVFFMVLVCERGILLMRNLWFGYKHLPLEEPKVPHDKPTMTVAANPKVTNTMANHVRAPGTDPRRTFNANAMD